MNYENLLKRLSCYFGHFRVVLATSESEGCGRGSSNRFYCLAKSSLPAPVRAIGGYTH